MTTILLRGGTVILHGENDTLSTMQADVLIEGTAISKIETSIVAPDGCEVIDCTNKIISPGFVDTHRHMWETALKGLCEDLLCVPYFAQSMSPSPSSGVNM
jgi:cytosine/adenosine deaminase-related metal-dependent hydrolase